MLRQELFDILHQQIPAESKVWNPKLSRIETQVCLDGTGLSPSRFLGDAPT